MIKVSFIVNKSTKFFTDYAQSSAYWIPQQSTKKKALSFLPFTTNANSHVNLITAQTGERRTSKVTSLPFPFKSTLFQTSLLLYKP